MHAKRTLAPRWQPPADALVLAAVDRAERHRRNPLPGVLLSGIADHLGMTWGPVASRRLRPILDRLAKEHGWLECSRRQSRDYWALTGEGGERLSRALFEGIVDELPESPQHREWRAAREYAAARIEELRGELGELLAKVNALLDADEPGAAADWLAVAKPLKDLTTAVGVATYCLYEHPEPDDARADHDEFIHSCGNRVSWRHYQIWDPGHVDSCVAAPGTCRRPS